MAREVQQAQPQPNARGLLYTAGQACYKARPGKQQQGSEDLGLRARSTCAPTSQPAP